MSQEDLQYLKYLKEKTVLAFDQLSGNVLQYQDFVDPTWYIAKNLNIDTEETEEEQKEDTNSKKKGKKEQKKK